MGSLSQDMRRTESYGGQLMPDKDPYNESLKVIVTVMIICLLIFLYCWGQGHNVKIR